MNQAYTAVVKQDGGWWIGWIEEVPGVNCQERTRKELLKSLRTTLSEALCPISSWAPLLLKPRHRPIVLIERPRKLVCPIPPRHEVQRIGFRRIHRRTH